MSDSSSEEDLDLADLADVPGSPRAAPHTGLSDAVGGESGGFGGADVGNGALMTTYSDIEEETPGAGGAGDQQTKTAAAVLTGWYTSAGKTKNEWRFQLADGFVRRKGKDELFAAMDVRVHVHGTNK